MGLAKTAFALAPFILKARSRRPSKRLAGVIFSAACMGLTGIFLTTAAFVWITKAFGAEFGFLAVAAIFFVFANLIYFTSRADKVEPQDVSAQLTEERIAQYIPDELQSDPRIIALLEKIKEHPLEATAAAVSLGFIISNQIIGD